MSSRKGKITRASSSITLTLPATSANLGPAFDAAALALSMFLRVRAEVAGDYSVVAEGRDAEICGNLKEHLILATYREVLKSEGKNARPLALRIRNQIPIGKGCGSSAAARLAGIALAIHFGRLRWNDDQIVGEAAMREHHPDNAAACWLGGLAVARMADERAASSGTAILEAQAIRITPKGNWPLLLAIPDEALSTEHARKVLPQQYSRTQAVANVQNSLLLLAALIRGRRDLLGPALQDNFHQPYRASLCPLLPALQELAGTPGVLGAVLSGAGPAVLIFLDSEANLKRTQMRIRDHLREKGLNAELLPTSITLLGARDRIRSSDMKF
jgi:homoserine kinase